MRFRGILIAFPFLDYLFDCYPIAFLKFFKIARIFIHLGECLKNILLELALVLDSPTPPISLIINDFKISCKVFFPI